MPYPSPDAGCPRLKTRPADWSRGPDGISEQTPCGAGAKAEQVAVRSAGEGVLAQCPRGSQPSGAESAAARSTDASVLKVPGRSAPGLVGELGSQGQVAKSSNEAPVRPRRPRPQPSHVDNVSKRGRPDFSHTPIL